jgi:hypothetical protein
MSQKAEHIFSYLQIVTHSPYHPSQPPLKGRSPDITLITIVYDNYDIIVTIFQSMSGKGDFYFWVFP